MSVLVVGLSHKSAPIDLLERTSLSADAAVKLASRALDAVWVNESAVIATCNRVELYVETDRFHGAVDELSDLLAEQAEMERDELVQHMYIHFDDAAVEHLFAVAVGLDSMVVGETQVLGQVRQALTCGQDQDTIGTSLNALFQQALRIGKRAHAETGIDRLGASVVDAGLSEAGSVIGAPHTRFLVAGAGAMSRLAITTLLNRGVDADRITVTNRTAGSARDLAASLQTHAIGWDGFDEAVAQADVLICATGAMGTIIDTERIGARAQFGGHRPLTIIDLALPRDVDPQVADVAGVTVIDLEVLGQRQENLQLGAEIQQVRAIVADEVTAFLRVKQASKVTPTVVALRSMATEIVDAELERARLRLPDLAEDVFGTLEQTVRRVADKLLHGPTVRVQQLADDQPGLTYADALADLFALDPATIDAVTRITGDGRDTGMTETGDQ